jgi:ABC-type antimicrobial peptide transport system permease subunit
LDVIRSQINEQWPQMKEWELVTTLRPLHEQLVKNVRTALWVLFAAVLCVLLIACLNVGSLLLARASPRSREMAIRSSLGAGRARLFRQMLTEAALLATAGCLAGLFVAVLVRQGLEAIRPAAIFHADAEDFSLALFAFVLVVMAGTVVATGLLPALTLSGLTPVEALKGGAANVSPGFNQRRLLGPLVVCQLSLTVVL